MKTSQPPDSAGVPGKDQVVPNPVLFWSASWRVPTGGAFHTVQVNIQGQHDERGKGLRAVEFVSLLPEQTIRL